MNKIKRCKKSVILFDFYSRLISKTLIRFVTNFLIMSLLGVIIFKWKEMIIALWVFMGFAAAFIFPFDVIDLDGNVRIKKSLRVLPLNSKTIFDAKYVLSVIMLLIYYSTSTLIVFTIRIGEVQFLDINKTCTFFIGLLCVLTLIFVIRINTTQIQCALIIIAIFIIMLITIASILSDLPDINIINLFTYIQKNRFKKWLFFGALPLLMGLNMLGKEIYSRNRSYKELR